MKRVLNGKRILVSALAVPALALGAMTLAPGQAEAAGPIPGPLCGPSYVWSCQKAGGPSIQFLGTICDKIAYEKANRAKCVPARP